MINSILLVITIVTSTLSILFIILKNKNEKKF